MPTKAKKAGPLALLAKFGLKILGFLGKGAKFLKFGLFAFSFASYAYLFTWKFAVLIMGSLFIHEYCHILAMKKVGMKTKGIYFIPFVGGAAVSTDYYKTYAENVFVAIMGPVGGLLLSVCCYVIYLITSNPLFAASAAWIAFVNLFNLMMISPLDGGQIVRAIAFSINKKQGFIFMVLSFVASIILLFKLGIGLFAFIAVIGLLDLIGMYAGRKRFMPEKLSTKGFIYSILSYVGTVIALIVVMKLTKSIPGADIASNFMAE